MPEPEEKPNLDAIVERARELYAEQNGLTAEQYAEMAEQDPALQQLRAELEKPVKAVTFQVEYSDDTRTWYPAPSRTSRWTRGRTLDGEVLWVSRVNDETKENDVTEHSTNQEPVGYLAKPSKITDRVFISDAVFEHPDGTLRLTPPLNQLCAFDWHDVTGKHHCRKAIPHVAHECTECDATTTVEEPRKALTGSLMDQVQIILGHDVTPDQLRTLRETVLKRAQAFPYTPPPPTPEPEIIRQARIASQVVDHELRHNTTGDYAVEYPEVNDALKALHDLVQALPEKS